MNKKINLTGQRFGRLIILKEVGRKNEQIIWRCHCDCGRKVNIRGDLLKNGKTNSCGCYQRERTSKTHTIHGYCKNPIYKIWGAMIDRCYNSNHKQYKDYGGRGIKVCRRWWKFKNFYKDMGDKPKGLTLERINNDGNYKPSNCKWATRQEQQHNIRCKGYCWNKQKQKWHASIKINYKQINLGLFVTPEEAHQAYLKAKKKYHRKDT